MSEDLSATTRKIVAGTTLDEADWRALTGTRDLIALGTAADEARRRRHGDRVTYVRVFEIPLGSSPGDASVPDETGELRLTGHPESMAAAVAAVRAAKARAGSVPVTGFAFEDLQRLCGDETGRLGEALGRLREAGLSLVSELAADRLTEPEAVFDVLRASDLAVTRLTMGAATGEGACPLLRRVATWGGAAAVCRTLAPLSCVERSPPATGYGDLRQVALARLVVDNIDSIQVDWTSHGPKLAQVALTFGADDVDGVPAAVPYDQGWRRSPGEEIRRNVIAAGFTPVPRNGCFGLIEV